MPESITVVLTSCNRFDLLQSTVDSFLRLNRYPVERFIISEDGNNKSCYDKIKKRYGLQAEVILQPIRLGCSLHLDALFAMVKTPWVFTIEDDWLFYSNPYFMEMSLQILSENQDIHQVWIRDASDHTHPLSKEEIIVSNIRCRDVLKGYQGVWGGFTFNPGLRRMSDLKRMFPNGLHEYGDEIVCNKHVDAQFNYRAVSLVQSSIRHIGWNRHTEGFKI